MTTSSHRRLDVEGLERDLDDLDVDPADAVDATPLGHLHQLVGRRQAAIDQIEVAVARARRAGISWGDVSRALGVSRQGARQRYGHVEASSNVVVGLFGSTGRSSGARVSLALPVAG